MRGVGRNTPCRQSRIRPRVPSDDDTSSGEDHAPPEPSKRRRTGEAPEPPRSGRPSTTLPSYPPMHMANLVHDVDVQPPVDANPVPRHVTPDPNRPIHSFDPPMQQAPARPDLPLPPLRELLPDVLPAQGVLHVDLRAGIAGLIEIDTSRASDLDLLRALAMVPDPPRVLLDMGLADLGREALFAEALHPYIAEWLRTDPALRAATDNFTSEFTMAGPRSEGQSVDVAQLAARARIAHGLLRIYYRDNGEPELPLPARPAAPRPAATSDRVVENSTDSESEIQSDEALYESVWLLEPLTSLIGRALLRAAYPEDFAGPRPE